MIIIRPYTHKQLAAMYGVSWGTFQKWLKPHTSDIGVKNGHFYSARQVEIIFDKIGLPEIERSD
jgi:transposase